MKRLLLLVQLGLAMAKTDPGDFARLCETGQCPEDWRNVDGNCVLFMSGWDKARATEHCKENEAEYRDFVFESNFPVSPGSLLLSHANHSLPVCVVRKDTQCSCGQTFRRSLSKIAGGTNVEKNEYPWQGKVHPYRINITD